MTSRSSELFAKARTRIPGGVNSPVRAFRGLGREPFFVERAEGAHIWDVDGNEYIDYVGTWGPAILGHAPRVVIDAVRDAAARGVSFGIPNPLEVEMAELICRWVPSIEKVRMVNSGTEATMSCLRLARGFTGRDKIIKFEGCYHGHVDSLLVNAGSGALTHGQPDSAGVPTDFADLTISLPFNDIEAVRAAFRDNAERNRRHHSRTDSGQRRPLFSAARIFSQELRDECTKHGALLIFDEVMTGFRVARGGAQEIYGIRARSDRARQSHRRRLAGRRVWRARGNHGSAFAARSGLSGGNAFRKSAGDGGGPGATARARADRWLDAARETRRGIRRWQRAMRSGRPKSRPRFHRIGSMFCLFFTQGPVFDLATAKRERHARNSRDSLTSASIAACIFAPSQFETGFLSTAHSATDIEKTCAIVREALETL